MPQMANITVKKSDGSTDIVYTALTPSAGDKVPAMWSQNAQSTRSLRPLVSAISQFNGPRDARRVTISGKYPIVRSINGVDTRVGVVPIELTVALPLVLTDSESSEACAQFVNLCKSVLLQDVLSSGYAPT